MGEGKYKSEFKPGESRPANIQWDTPAEVVKEHTVKSPREITVDDVLEGSGMEHYDFITCNHSPHPFTIGPKHMANSTGTYIDPKCAPCAHPGGNRERCSLSYEEHTYETALLVRGFKGTDEQEPIIEKLATAKGIFLA